MGYEDEDDDYLMISGIQHFEFCKRQWALIHVEQQWEEDARTVEGQHLHRNADKPTIREKRGDKLIVRAMPVKSGELKIMGICDVVEFVKHDNGVEISGEVGRFMAFPVEYKRGKPKSTDADLLQLAAQAICLEEMLLCDIPLGYIYYHEIRHRVEVPLSADIKNKVKTVVLEMHHYYNRKHTPKVKTGSFCRSCSLYNICLPQLMSKRTVKSYVEGKIKE